MRAAVSWLLGRRRAAAQRLAADDVHKLLSGTLITMLDVGAAGGILPRWRTHRKDVAFIGIEPDERSSMALAHSPEAAEFGGYEIIATGAWSKRGDVSIAFTRKPSCSSHFLPNEEFLSRFPDTERFEVVTSAEVGCQTVDSVLDGAGKSVDFIKLDLEGGELEVLRGADRTLGSCLGLQVEVSFQQLRWGQPLFGDISSYLSDRGIEFIDFLSFSRWERDSLRGSGQAITADALFLRPPEGVAAEIDAGRISQQKAKTYLAVLIIYERYDLASHFLSLIQDKGVFHDVPSMIERRRRAFIRRYGRANRVGALLGSVLHLLY